MKRGKGICFSVLLALFGMLLIFDGNNADAGPYDLFVGEWACNTYLPEGTQGPAFAGIHKTRIDSWGNVSGTGYAVVGVVGVPDPFIHSSLNGKVTEASNGFITIEATVTYENGEPRLLRQKCIGMTKSLSDGFQEVQCLDITVEPLETEERVMIMQCKKTFSSY